MHNIPKPNNSSVSNSRPEEIYQKQINLDLLKVKDIAALEKLINSLGYKNVTDYKFNHYNHKVELIIINRDLHRDLKIIRITKYTKINKD